MRVHLRFVELRVRETSRREGDPKLSSKAGIFLHENQRRAIEYISDDRIRLVEQLRDPVGLYKRVSAESHTLCKRSLGVVL